MTSRGMKEPEMKKIGAWIAEALRNPADEARLAGLRQQVLQLAGEFPLYRWHIPQVRDATLARASQ